MMRWLLLVVAAVGGCSGSLSDSQTSPTERIVQLEVELSELRQQITDTALVRKLQQVGPPGWLTDHRGRRFRIWDVASNVIENAGFLVQYPPNGLVAAPSEAVTEVMQGPSQSEHTLYYTESYCTSEPMVCTNWGPAADLVVDRQGAGTQISDYTIFRVLKSAKPVSAVVRSRREYDRTRCTDLDAPRTMQACWPIEPVEDNVLKQQLMLAYPIKVTFESYPF